MRAQEVGRVESHSHPYHVDIQVGSCTCLNVLVAITCALRWGITHIGDYHYRALFTLSRENYFRYRKCSGRRRSLEAAFEKKADM